jgi:hypothetical protein
VKYYKKNINDDIQFKLIKKENFYLVIFFSKSSVIPDTSSNFDLFLTKHHIDPNDLNYTAESDCEYTEGYVQISSFSTPDRVTITTDKIGNIPIYIQNLNGYSYFSSHPDLFIFNDSNFSYDYTSISEFLLVGVVTFPFTCYEKIKQASPSTIYTYIDGNIVDQQITWKPAPRETFQNLNEYTEHLNSALHDAARYIVSTESDFRLFLSGGDDSRLLATIFSNYCDLNCEIFTSNNRETIIANKITDICNYNSHRTKVSYDFYLENHGICSSIAGLGHQYMHLHAYSVDRKYAYISGYLADALFKGSRMHTKKIKYLPFDFKIPSNGSITLFNNNKLKFIRKDVINEINSRRELFSKNKIFASSTNNADYFGFYPLSQYKSSPFSFSQRRFIDIYDPFTSYKLIDLSFQCKDEWKLNRVLYSRLHSLNSCKSKYVPHTNGHILEFNYMINLFVTPLIKILRRIVNIRINRVYEGSWINWGSFLSSNQFRLLYENDYSFIFKNITHLKFNSFLKNRHFKKSNKSSLIQTLHTINIQKDVKKDIQKITF